MKVSQSNIFRLELITNGNVSQNLLGQSNWQISLEYLQISSSSNASNIPNQCTGHPQYITSGRGVVTSPGYPRRYGNLQDCVWLLRTRPGYIFEFSFPPNETITTTFQVEASPNCVNDYLEFSALLPRTSQVSTIADITRDAQYLSIGKFCGFQQFPFNFLQTYNELAMIRFSTNDQITMSGFKINYKSGIPSFLSVMIPIF